MKDQEQQSKFADDKELLSAYNALEREFTKRCQLIKELQAQLDALTAQANTELPVGNDGAEQEAAAQATEETPEAQTPQEIVSTETPEVRQPQESLTEREILEYVAARASELAELLSQIPEIADACIARYKQRILGCRTVRTPRGAAVITPAHRPRTLDEAKRLVDAFF